MRQTLEKWKLLAIIFLLVVLIKPYTGVTFGMETKTNLPTVQNDLPISAFNKRPIAEAKLKAAIENPRPRPAAPTPRPAPKPVEVASITVTSYKVTPPEEVNALIDKYALEYRADPILMKSIAKCESGFRAEAVNGGFGGMYQFLASTWSSNRRAMGLDPNPDLRFNAEEAVRTAAFKMGRDGYGAWPACYQKALAISQ